MTASSEYSDLEALKEAHQFVWEEDDEPDSSNWKYRLAKQYYNELYKEFALADLRLYPTEKKIGLRWRTKGEVIVGKGTECCGSVECNSVNDLSTLEVPFEYEEKGKSKIELVKVKLCTQCTLIVLQDA